MTRNREILLLALSVLIQIQLAVLLGHYYDQKIAMATGYLVSQGLSPYETANFVGLFPHFLLNGIIQASVTPHHGRLCLEASSALHTRFCQTYTSTIL